MPLKANAFDRSILEQIRINQARTPTERFLAFCELLDSVAAMAPMDPESIERRKAFRRIRQQNKEQMRAYFRRLIADYRYQDDRSL